MNNNVKFYIFYALLYGLILLIGEGLYRLWKVKPAVTRNFSHLAAGLVSLPFPWIFSSHWWVMTLALQSSLFLFVSKRSGWIPSHHKSAPRSTGSYLFFASIYLCFLVEFKMGNKAYFTVPMLILSVGDVFAAAVGRNFGKIPIRLARLTLKGSKTLEGSLAFLLSSFAVLIFVLLSILKVSFTHTFFLALLISLASTLTEALSPNGYDNFSVPCMVLLIMYLASF